MNGPAAYNLTDASPGWPEYRGGAMASKGISLRLNDEQIARLDHIAQGAGQTRSELATMLLAQALRLSEYPHLVLRDFGTGPEIFLSGSRLRAWWVASLIRAYEGDITRTAEHLNLQAHQIEEVRKYAEAFPDEIEAAIADNERRADELERQLRDRSGVKADLTANAPAS
jgi:hypothetical protein